MKNRFNFSQIAEVYCNELGVYVPCMEDYLKAIFKDLPTDIYEQEIEETLRNRYDGKSEFFPEYKKKPLQANLEGDELLTI